MWFEENAEKIRKISKGNPANREEERSPYDGNAFWKKNVLFIEEGRKIKLSEFLRELDELNYQKFTARMEEFPATREPGKRSHDSAKALAGLLFVTNRKALGQTGSSRRMTADKKSFRDWGNFPCAEEQ